MGLSIKGYVLEPPRVGAANSPYTYTPNNFISDSVAWSAVYPDGSEPQPRADYFVLVLQDGFLVDSRFGWTKNEVVQRFDYAARDQRFVLLGGAPITNVGTVTPDVNTTRLTVTAPIQPWVDAPYRLSVGALPGTALTLTQVPDFTGPPPAVGEVQVDPAGSLNWNAGDITTYDGQPVWFQRQQFYTPSESSGSIGLLDGSDLYLNPLPATGQFPLLRIGFGLWLKPIEVGSPASGEVRWDAATGEVTFNAADVAANPDKPVYYDGVLFGYDLALPVQTLGAMPSGGNMFLPVLPAEGGDLIFRATPGPLAVTVQFPITTRLAGPTDPVPGVFDPVGKAGYVQIKSDGLGGADVLFSVTDRALYTGMIIECVSGDLLLERGISARFFRCSANLDASDSTVKDVSAFYSVAEATLAEPIIGSPIVSLPALPIDDPGYPFTINVEQGTGTFPPGPLSRLDGPTPVVTPGITIGYTLDFEGRQLQYGQRKNWNGSSVPDLMLQVPSGAAQLPDTLLSSSYLDLQLETAPNSGVFVPLDIGTDALVDLLGGVVSFVTTAGETVPTSGGGNASFTGTTLSDVLGAFASVQPGDLVILPSNPSEAVYTVVSVQSGPFFDAITTDVAVPSPMTNVAYEIRRGREVLADRFWAEAQPLDPNTKVERIRSLGAIPSTPPYLTLPTPFRNGVSVEFADTVTVTTVPDDSKFTPSPAVNVVEVSLSTGNLNLTRADVVAPRFRYGLTNFSTSVVMVKDNSGFTAPASLPTKEAEISLATGAVNYSQTDFGLTSYWVRKLRRKVDYRLTAHLGFIEFAERMYVGEEALVTYAPLVDGEVQPVVEESSTWIIRKEVIPSRSGPVVTAPFNPNGYRVASNPPPAVFRGGRPQDSTQVKIDTVNSTITFLPDNIRTNVLPHGPILSVDERVYIDYYIYDAVGGEKTTTVLQPPMSLAVANITEGEPSFVIAGDQTAIFPAGYLLRVEQDDVYQIGTSIYDSGEDQTTVTLASGSVFRNSLADPKLYVASGPTPVTSLPWKLAYFRTETASYDVVARGMNLVSLSGDLTSVYRVGTVLAFTDSGSTFFETYLASGISYDAAKDRTKIVLTQNVLRQYTSGTHILRYTSKPILDDQTTQAQASRTPVLTQPYSMYRRLEGQPGRLLSSPVDFTMDDSGLVEFTSPMLPGEELVLLYTGHRIVLAGTRLRFSYTSTIAPTAQNGLADQILTADYWLYSPDTFYFRVEKLSNFQAEIAKEFQKEAQGSSPSGGPTTSNASQPKLYEQGRESLFFQEGHLANADIVMRAFLKFFNDAVNYLEDVLQDMDGRLVGDSDGRFLFDGEVDNPTRLVWADVTNQIDDVLKVSEFPVSIGPIPPFPPVFTFVGTYQKAYLPGRWSRFFPMYRASLSSFTSAGSSSGDEIGDLKWTHLTGTDPTAFWRLPRAALIRNALAGDTVLYVDNSEGASEPVIRPPFAATMKVIVADRTTVYISDAAPLTVSGTASGPPQELHVSALPIDLPAGATVYVCTTGLTPDPFYTGKTYRVGQDLAINYGGGKLGFVNAFWPLDGSVPLIPAELCVHEVGSGECLQINNIYCNNTLLAPFRFPALDGKNISDCGDQAIPMFVSTENEGVRLSNEADDIADLQAATDPTAVISGGTLNAPRTTISTVAPLPAPAIQQFDLVRITTGVNATAGFRRVLSSTANSITVDMPFPTVDTGFDFIVTAAANVFGPAAFTVITVSPMVVQSAGLLLGVNVGQTFIVTNGTAGGTRRQITVKTTVGPNTQLTLDAAFTVGTSTLFRVSKHLSTFGPLTALAAQVTSLLGILRDNDLPTSISSEIKAIDRLFDGNPVQGTQGIFTNILSPASHPGTVSGSVLTRTDGVDLSVANSAHYVFIRTGGNLGIYSVQSSTVTDITVNGSFPVAGAVTYRVISVFGFSKPGLTDIMCALKVDEAFVAASDTFESLVTTLLPVTSLPADPSAFATGVTTDALNARLIELTQRTTDLTTAGSGLIDLLSGIMSSKEKLYDKRYTWIDARINRKSGQVSKQIASFLDRLTKTTEQQNSLSKMIQIDKLLDPKPPTPEEEAAPPPPLCP
jgi:hypothetical protein